MRFGRVDIVLRSDLVRAIALVVLALLLSQTLPVQAQQVATLRAVAVSRGAWALVGPLGGPSRGNHALIASYGVVAMPEGTILIDSGASAQGARLLADMAQQLTGQPVRWVINTGSQHHRWFGNETPRKAGAQVIAHARTVQTQRTLASSQTAELQALLGDRFDGTVTVQVEHVLSGARSELTLGGVRLLSLSPLTNVPSWLRAFERLVALASAQVVPGHGAPTSIDVAQVQTGAYLRFVTTGVARHAKEMVGVEAALAELGEAPAFAQLDNFAQLHRANINRAYLRAEAGD